MYYLYRYFDKNRTLLYIGMTNNFDQREASHRRYAKWWKSAGTKTIKKYRNQKCAEQAEIDAIAKESPMFNVTGNGQLLNRKDSEPFDHICKRCGHKWRPRTLLVKACPSCKSYRWNVERTDRIMAYNRTRKGAKK